MTRDQRLLALADPGEQYRTPGSWNTPAAPLHECAEALEACSSFLVETSSVTGSRALVLYRDPDWRPVCPSCWLELEAKRGRPAETCSALECRRAWATEVRRIVRWWRR